MSPCLRGELYVPLRTRSNYSLLSGASSIDSLLDRAASLGMTTLALTDECNLYGAVSFFQKARERGVKPILGAILDESGAPARSPLPPGERVRVRGGRRDPSPQPSPLRGERETARAIAGPQAEVVLLVRDGEGYANLCELISGCRLDDDFSLAEALPGRQEGLFVLASNAEFLERLARDVDRGRLLAEIIRSTGPSGRDVNAERALVETAKRLGVDVVASTDVYFAGESDFELHEILSAMRLNTTLEDVRAGEIPGTHCGPRGASDCSRAGPASPDTGRAPPAMCPRNRLRLRSPAEMSRLFFDLPEAVANTLRVAEACEFDLLGLTPVFPKVPGDSAARLREATHAGARKRYPPAGGYARITRTVRDRIEKELDLIVRLGFPDYFLVVADIVRHARALGTPVAGRGSGASSVVAYSLGITNVDPIRFHLPFERFLNEGRRDFPDLDVDFCWRLRDSVIDYVYKTYGDEHVAMIATYATMQPRLAFRESAKALGMSDPVITEVMGKLASKLPRKKWRTLPADPDTVEEALRFAGRLDGFPHHLSVHCGGVVITPGPIARRAPLERAAKGVVITQYDKDGVEAVGLVKLDLLGNRALSSIAESVRLAARSGVTIDPEGLPERDILTERLLVAGDTVGVNQLESPAMRHLCCQVFPATPRPAEAAGETETVLVGQGLPASRPTDRRALRSSPAELEALMQVLALIRPGAASLGMKDAFVRRARGLEPVPPIDPRLDDILRKTYGVMLYEDDALFIASALAGLPPEKADRFRRAVTKCRSDEERERLSREFLGRAERNGVDMKIASDLWVQMAKFNSYSFCRAHAASYARLAWANAYMKAHHPAEFWVAALNNNEGMYPRWVYVEEAKRAGVTVRLPCVNRSDDEFALEDGAIRVGLGRVKGLSIRARESIMEARPFAGLADLVARTEVRQAEAEDLVRAGAFDFTGRRRPEILLELYSGFEDAKRMRGTDARLFRVADGPAPYGLRGYSDPERFRDEWRLVGLSVGRHPMAWIRRRLARMGVQRSKAINRDGQDGQDARRTESCKSRIPLSDAADIRVAPSRVRLSGLVATGRTAHTSRGEEMCFLTLSDEDGLFDVSLFPDVYARARRGIAGAGIGPLLVEGKVEDHHGAVSVTASRVEPLTRNGSPLRTSRHDSPS